VWTDLFMLVERWIEGDRNARMKRDAGPWTRDKLVRKIAKHWVWLWIAFWTGGAWVMYFVNAPVVVGEFWTLRASPDVYALTGLFTLTTYLLAGWAREQVCTYMCPWPRFQSAMLDEQSIIVTYQGWRGEKRGHAKHGTEKFGDCVDCDACVHVCPTGIDIRDGVQLECINCGLCIDACNHVMEKLDRDPWLITWDTLSGQKAKAEGRTETLHLVRPRTVIYLTALLMCSGLVAYGLVARATTNLSIIHDHGQDREQDTACRLLHRVDRRFARCADGTAGTKPCAGRNGACHGASERCWRFPLGGAGESRGHGRGSPRGNLSAEGAGNGRNAPLSRAVHVPRESQGVVPWPPLPPPPDGGNFHAT
jgi:cytochrome c oxidase accessory protein FixG